VLERVLGAHSRDAAEVGVDVTLAMRASGHPDAAARHCRRALVAFEKSLPPDHPRIVKTRALWVATQVRLSVIRVALWDPSHCSWVNSGQRFNGGFDREPFIEC